MENTIVTIKNLSHRYAKDWAAKDINFDINKNGIIGLLGANGAGKSTIMNIMCGVLNQTEGEVLIDGVNIRKNAVEAKKKIGFLPQKAPLYLDNTIQEYLVYCANLRKMEKKDITDAVARVKKLCGLGLFSERLIKNLSGGFKQRVGIAGAIIHDPSLVVLDEPTVGLDPVQVVEVRKIIQDIGKNRAVIFSTHIMAEVEAVCNDLKMIHNGQMVFSGTVQEFNNYIEPNSLTLVFAELPAPEALQKIGGVIEIQPITEKKVKITFDTNKEGISEAIIATSVANNWRLQELIIERSSMEDIFARITQDQN